MTTPHSVVHARSYVEEVEKKPDESKDAKDAKKKGVVSNDERLLHATEERSFSSSWMTHRHIIHDSFHSAAEQV